MTLNADLGTVLYDWWIEHFRCDFLIAKLNGEPWAQGEWEEHAGHRAQARAYVESQMAAVQASPIDGSRAS